VIGGVDDYASGATTNGVGEPTLITRRQAYSGRSGVLVQPPADVSAYEQPSRPQTPARLSAMNTSPMSSATMSTAAITCAVIAVGAPKTDPVEPLISRRAREARTSAARGNVKASTARPLEIATSATVAKVGLLGSDDTVATPIRAKYWAKKSTGLASRELMAQTSAAIALVE